LEIGRSIPAVVIPGRSKERSDARRPWNPCRDIEAPLAVQNSGPLHSTAIVTEWILGSALRCASLRPWMTKLEGGPRGTGL